MLSRLLITASVAGLLCVAPAVAKDAQSTGGGSAAGQGGQGGSDQTAGQALSNQGGQASGNDNAASQAQGDNNKVMPTTGDQDDQGAQSADKTKSPSTGDQDNQNAQSTGKTKKSGSEQAAGDNPKKKKQTADEQNQKQKQTGQKAEANKKNKNSTGADADNDNMATGSTNRAKTEITTEKRTVIREKLVTNKVTRVDRNDIDFNLSIGIAVPSTITVLPLPATVVEIVPEYRDYLYFVLADGTIVIVEPGTMQIVTMIAA